MKNFAIGLLTFSLCASTQIAVAAQTPKKGEISLEKATRIATKASPGTVKSSEYEFEKGQNVYSFDIGANDGTIHEVLVSARTGKIVSSTVESAAKEASEVKADQKHEQD